MDKYYYNDVNNQKAGPISPSEFKSYGITADTLVWKDGMASKVKAGDLPQLKPHVLPGKINKKWILIPIGCGCLGLLLCFIVAIILLFFSDCGGSSEYATSDYDNIYIIEEEDTKESDSILYWRSLAEEYMERAKYDASIIKEKLPLARRKLEYAKTHGSDDSFSIFIKQTDLSNKENAVNEQLSTIFDWYQKGKYDAVITYSNLIEREKMEILDIIDKY